jgi:hypothetical protein
LATLRDGWILAGFSPLFEREPNLRVARRLVPPLTSCQRPDRGVHQKEQMRWDTSPAERTAGVAGEALLVTSLYVALFLLDQPILSTLHIFLTSGIDIPFISKPC